MTAQPYPVDDGLQPVRSALNREVHDEDRFQISSLTPGSRTIVLSAISVGAGLVIVTSATAVVPLLIAGMAIGAGIAGVGAGIGELALSTSQSPTAARQTAEEVDRALAMVKGPISLGLATAGAIGGAQPLANIGVTTGVLSQAILNLNDAAEAFLDPQATWKVGLELADAALDIYFLDWSDNASRDSQNDMESADGRRSHSSQDLAKTATSVARARGTFAETAADRQVLRLHQQQMAAMRQAQAWQQDVEKARRDGEDQWQRHLEQLGLAFAQRAKAAAAAAASARRTADEQAGRAAAATAEREQAESLRRQAEADARRQQANARRQEEELLAMRERARLNRQEAASRRSFQGRAGSGGGGGGIDGGADGGSTVNLP